MAAGKGLKLLGGVIVAVLLILAAAIAGAYILFPPSKIKAMVLPVIKKSLGREVEIQKVGLTFFPGVGANLRGISIANTGREGFADDPFVSIGGLQVHVKVFPLLKKDVQVTAVRIEEPWVLIETDREGSFNFNDLALLTDTSSKSEPVSKKNGPLALPVPLTLQKFEIINGRILFHDRKARRRIELGNINQEVGFSINRTLTDVQTSGKLTVSDITLQTREVPIPLSGITVSLDHDIRADITKGEAEIKTVKASLQKIGIALSGTISNFNEKPALDLAITSTSLSLSDILAEIPTAMVPEIEKTRGQGTLQLDVAVKGTLDSGALPAVKGQLLLRDGKIHYADLPQSINSMRADIRFSENHADIRELALKIGANPVMLKARIDDFTTPRVDAHLKADVNLDEVKQIVKLPDGNSLGGMVKADIQAKGEVDPADPAKLAVKGAVTLQNIVATTPAVTVPVHVSGNIDLSNTRISHKATMGLGSSHMRISVNLSDYLGLVLPDSTKTYPRPRLDFSIASSSLNTNEFLPPPPPASAQGATSAPSAPSSAANVPLLLAAPLPGIDIHGTVSNDHLRYQDAVLSDVKVTVKAVDDIMDVKVHSRMFEGTFGHDLRIDARNYHDLGITSRLKIDNIECSKLITAFKGQIPEDIPLSREIRKLDKSLYGKISLTTDFTSHGGTAPQVQKNLKGPLSATLRDGRIARGILVERVMGVLEKIYKPGDIQFRTLTCEATVRDEKVFVEDLALSTDNLGDWHNHGSIGFDASLAMKLENRLPVSVSRTLVGAKGKLVSSGAALASQYLGDKAGKIVSGAGESLGPQADKDGRVTVALGLKGSVMDPKPSSFEFKKGEGNGGGGTSVKEQVTTKAKEELQKAREELLKKKKQAEEEARRRLEAEKARLAEEARKREQELREKARQEKERLRREAEEKKDDLKDEAKKRFKKLF